eukprot:754130-Hanusia_phi.AAC.1
MLLNVRSRRVPYHRVVLLGYGQVATAEAPGAGSVALSDHIGPQRARGRAGGHWPSHTVGTPGRTLG